MDDLQKALDTWQAAFDREKALTAELVLVQQTRKNAAEWVVGLLIAGQAQVKPAAPTGTPDRGA